MGTLIFGSKEEHINLVFDIYRSDVDKIEVSSALEALQNFTDVTRADLLTSFGKRQTMSR